MEEIIKEIKRKIDEAETLIEINKILDKIEQIWKQDLTMAEAIELDEALRSLNKKILTAKVS